MSVYRIYVEKKPEFAVEANSLIGGIKSALGLENLTGLRVINRYDAEGLSREDFDLAAPVVFSEPAVDVTYDHLPAVKADEFVFAVEYLPGQFDQRADSCAQCISLLTGGKRPTIKSARIYIVSGKLTEAELDQIKHYMINPVESREASLDCFDTLDIKYTIPTTVKTVEGFIYSTDDDLRFMLTDLGLAMDFDDIKFCQDYFKNVEKRNPTITEIRMIDTYWSDHCRHTTFSTIVDNVSIDSDYIAATFADYINTRKDLYAGRTDKPVTLMDLACIGAKQLKKAGLLKDLDETKARTFILPGGYSEQNLGLSMDIVSASSDFASTKEFSWLVKNAQDYGFILRYPENKTDKTGMNYQPWHWRYVGKEAAKAMNKSGLCLEEYLKAA